MHYYCRVYPAVTATPPATLTVADDIARLLIVYDRQFNGGTAGLAAQDFLLNVDGFWGTPLQSATSQDYINYSNRDRFDVLVDEKIHLPGYYYQNTASGSGGPTITFVNESFIDPLQHSFQFENTIDLQGRRTVFTNSDNAGNPTNTQNVLNVSSGAIYMVIYSVNNAEAVSGYSIDYCIRTQFYDC
jgi:hypothetical protein